MSKKRKDGKRHMMLAGNIQEAFHYSKILNLRIQTTKILRRVDEIKGLDGPNIIIHIVGTAKKREDWHKFEMYLPTKEFEVIYHDE